MSSSRVPVAWNAARAAGALVALVAVVVPAPAAANAPDVAYRCVPLDHVPSGQGGVPPHVTRTGVEHGGLRLYASVPPEAPVSSGRPITISLVATNSGDAPVSVSFSTTQQFDAVVWNDNCREVWRWSAGRMFGQIVQSMSVPAHAKVTYRIPWDLHDQAGRQVRAGAYEVQVLFFGRAAYSGGPVVLPALTFAVR